MPEQDPTEQQLEDIDRLAQSGQMNYQEARERVLGQTPVANIGRTAAHGAHRPHPTRGRGPRGLMFRDAGLSRDVSYTEYPLPEMTEEETELAKQRASALVEAFRVSGSTTDYLSEHPDELGRFRELGMVPADFQISEQITQPEDREALEAYLTVLDCFAQINSYLGYLHVTSEDHPERDDVEARYASQGPHVLIQVAGGVVGNLFNFDEQARKSFRKTLPADISEEDFEVPWRDYMGKFAGADNADVRKEAQKTIRQKLKNHTETEEAA